MANGNPPGGGNGDVMSMLNSPNLVSGSVTAPGGFLPLREQMLSSPSIQALLPQLLGSHQNFPGLLVPPMPSQPGSHASALMRNPSSGNGPLDFSFQSMDARALHSISKSITEQPPGRSPLDIPPPGQSYSSSALASQTSKIAQFEAMAMQSGLPPHGMSAHFNHNLMGLHNSLIASHLLSKSNAPPSLAPMPHPQSFPQSMKPAQDPAAVLSNQPFLPTGSSHTVNSNTTFSSALSSSSGSSSGKRSRPSSRKQTPSRQKGGATTAVETKSADGESDGGESDEDEGMSGKDERKEARREYHKRIERKRRDRMKGLYEALRELTQLTAPADKNAVLQGAVTLIKELKTENETLRKRGQHVESGHASLPSQVGTVPETAPEESERGGGPSRDNSDSDDSNSSCGSGSNANSLSSTNESGRRFTSSCTSGKSMSPSQGNDDGRSSADTSKHSDSTLTKHNVESVCNKGGAGVTSSSPGSSITSPPQRKRTKTSAQTRE